MSVAPAKPLSKTAVNVIEPRMGLAYAVTVLNSGCRRETQIGVRLEIASPGQPVIGHAQIDHIDPGEEKTVLIGHLGLPVLDKKLVLHVEVEPVPTEVSLDNNSAEYSVRYVLS